MKYFPPDKTLALLRCFDACLNRSTRQAGINGVTQAYRQRCYPLLDDLQDDWFRTVGFADCWVVPSGDDWVDVELEPDPDFSDRLRYRSPDRGGWVTVDSRQAAIIQVRPDKVITGLSELMEIPDNLRIDAGQCEIRDCFWRLGTVRLREGFHYPVWLFRGGGADVIRLVERLQHLQCREKGIIVSCSSRSKLPDDLPGEFYGLPVQAALIDYLPYTRLDLNIMYQAITSVRNSLIQSLPVSYDKHSKTLIIKGKEPWVIRGDKHAAAVEYLYEQSLRNIWEVKAGDILKAVRCKTNKSNEQGSKTINALFEDNHDWCQYIVRTSRGKYGFRIS
jgi:hypothetical protein